MANTNKPVNAFEKGNRIHELALNTGRPKLFGTPEDLWATACGYFEYCTDNPIPYLAYRYDKLRTVYKMQAMSVRGLSIYLGISIKSIHNYKKQPGFAEVVDRINNVMYIHNFSGACAGLLNERFVLNQGDTYASL